MERRAEKKRRKDDGKNESKFGSILHNQVKRDAELLNILRKREIEMEGNMMKKIEAFKYLYKEQLKEFDRLMKES